MELSTNQMNDLMKRFPDTELSYETICHKKVSSPYEICIAVPQGKKAFAWFSFFRKDDVCFLMELGREKKVCRVNIAKTLFDPALCLGTLLYGTLWEENNATNDPGSIQTPSTAFTELGRSPTPSSSGSLHRFFVIEDIFYCKGVPLRKSPFCEKLGFLHDTLKQSIVQKFSDQNGIVFALPVMWDISRMTGEHIVPADIANRIPYPVHHLQYRALGQIVPYLNFPMNRKMGVDRVNVEAKIEIKTEAKTEIKTEAEKDLTKYIEIRPIPRFDFTKPQFRYPTTFLVTADIQFDIYHLYAYGKNRERAYCGLAYIPNCKSSMFMNGLFRNIRENLNLDNIEESDDEEDFQDTRIDKYVDLSKTLEIECQFHSKFKKWVPLRVLPENSAKIVHLGSLIAEPTPYTNNYNQKQQNYQNQKPYQKQNNYPNQNQHQQNQNQNQQNYPNQKPYQKNYQNQKPYQQNYQNQNQKPYQQNYQNQNQNRYLNNYHNKTKLLQNPSTSATATEF